MHRNYNIAQTTTALSLDLNILNNNITKQIEMLVDTIPHNIIETSVTTTGCPTDHPAMLMKILLFTVYSIKVFSGNRTAEMNTENIPMKWLSQDTKISHVVINNFRSSKEVSDLIKFSFVYFASCLDVNEH